VEQGKAGQLIVDKRWEDGKMSEFKERMMMCSEDYDEMIDMALAMKDKEWFEELIKRQKRLREMEIEARRELGVLD
jgi:hypothetical protein